MRGLIYIFLVAVFCSCQKSHLEMEGQWRMHKVIQNNEDVSEEHNPHKERYVIFKNDSSFLSGGRPFGENSGQYTYDKEQSTLFLDSDVGPEDDSNWKISFNGDTMTWQGYGTEWAENFQLVHIRVRE